MKEVKKEVQKENLNLTIFELLKQGKKPKDISNELNITMPNLSYYLSKLIKEGYVKKIGYGTWEVKINTLNTIKSKNKLIRGHAFIWTIKLNKKFNWLELLKNTNYNLVRNKTPRLIINNNKIWLGKSTITVYENKSFYAINSLDSRKYAVVSLIELIEALQKKLNINLRPYIFKPAREHYGMIKNDLARQYNRNNEKMIIKDDIEGEWLWIDDSESLGELETKNIVRSKQVQNWWNDNKKFNFTVTPSFLMESITKLTNAQIESNRQLLLYEQQNKEHLKLIKQWQKSDLEWRKSESKKIKDNITNGVQTNLTQW